MKISANSIRAGNILVYKDELYVVTKMPEHTQPGKGGAYMQVEMKKLKSNTKIYVRFSASDYVERAHLEEKKCTYLYKEGNNFIFMNSETFDQIYLDEKIVDQKFSFLSENMQVTLEMFGNEAINLVLPSTVVLEIVQTDPVIKDSTSKASYKPAVLSNGITVKVPSYIVPSTRIVVKTEDSTYVERAK